MVLVITILLALLNLPVAVCVVAIGDKLWSEPQNLSADRYSADDWCLIYLIWPVLVLAMIAIMFWRINEALYNWITKP